MTRFPAILALALLIVAILWWFLGQRTPTQPVLLPGKIADATRGGEVPANLWTNHDGAIYHRDGTNLWWLGGAVPQDRLDNVLNFPSLEEERAIIAAQDAQRLSPDQLVSAFNAINRQPILFYGRAVDEKTNGLAGATAKGLFVTKTAGGGEREERHSVTTDEQGYFTVAGEGTTLTVGVTKEPTHHYAPVRSFHYSEMYAPFVHKPDPFKPILFVLPKVQGAEPLIYFTRGYRAPNTGEPVRIDLRACLKKALYEEEISRVG